MVVHKPIMASQAHAMKRIKEMERMEDGGRLYAIGVVWRVGLTGYSTFPTHAQPQLNSIKIINPKVMVERVEHIA